MSDSDPEFSTTHWSTILAAGQTPSPAAERALERLCRGYWYPLYAYVRRQEHDVADAKDLTQEFFVRFLEHNYVRRACRERGRFRTFLLTSLKHFLINEWKGANSLKRGGGQKTFSLDEEQAEQRFAADLFVEQSPDALYDQRWGMALLQQALDRLREELTAEGKAASFDQLKDFVWGGKPVGSYASVAESLGMSEGALKVAVHRLRQRFGELLRAEVARTVSTPVEIDEELQYLITVLRSIS